MNQPIISVSGLRGIVGTSLDPTIAINYTAAFAGQLQPGSVVISRDGRESGQMLANAVGAALSALGRDVLYADVAATPTLGILVRETRAAGGIQLSASHNPREYNGMKLFGPDGRVISANVGQRVLDAMDERPDWCTVDNMGSFDQLYDTTSAHLEKVLATVDVEAIKQRSFKVILDSNHGAGGVLGRPLLEALGCEVLIAGEEPDGQFAHAPEPTAENLAEVTELAARQRVDVTFCQDPDADRLAIIDSDGNYIGEEYTPVLALMNRLATQPGNCVVNCSSSRMSLDVAERFGVQCHLSAVGEANVCDLMIAVNAVYGGEGSGGPIDPRVGYVRDSFVGMAQVLDLMAKSGKSVSDLVNELPRYAIHKAKTSVNREAMSSIYATLRKKFSEARVNEQDGLRLDWPDHWLLVRPSNTEPIVRVICEAGTEAMARQKTEAVLELIGECS